MKLYYQTHSPFARKTLVFAHEAGVANGVDVQHCETSPTKRNEDIYRLNPLGKVPVLVLENNQTIFDSGLICEHFDSISQYELIPKDTEKRIEALKVQALSDGLSDAGILVRWERTRRPERFRYKEFEIAQLQKIESTLTYLNGTVNFKELNIGHIALASSVSWLEFREIVQSFERWPLIDEWYSEIIRRSSMLATQMAGDTFD